MNIKNKFFVFYIFFSILTLSVIYIKNPEKTKFYLFTSKTEEISLGSLITITFLSGCTFSSLLTLFTKNNSQKSLDDNFINDEESDKEDNYNLREEEKYDRPPERDIRESQPTVTVNYRFVDQKNNSYDSKNIKNTTDNPYNDDNDWFNNDNEW